MDVSRISCCGERGLLGIAFPPAYAAKQHFYVRREGATTFSRFRTTAYPDIADPGSEEVVLLSTSHNGGNGIPKMATCILAAEIGGQGSHAETAQTATFCENFVDVESTSTTPSDNPWLKASWALGLRNPWGFAFDKKTGALYIPPSYGGELPAGIQRRRQQLDGPLGSKYFPLMPCRAEGFTQPVAEYDNSQVRNCGRCCLSWNQGDARGIPLRRFL